MAKCGQAHPSGGAEPCQEPARGGLTRRSAGPRTALKVTIRNPLRGLRCNSLLDLFFASLPFLLALGAGFFSHLPLSALTLSGSPFRHSPLPCYSSLAFLFFCP